MVEKKYWVCHVEVDYPDGSSTCYIRLIEAENRGKAKRLFNDAVLRNKKGGKWSFITYGVIESTYWIKNNK